MPEYTLFTIVAMVALILVELVWVRTGIFTSLRYWATMIIVFGFQTLVDGWLTRLPDPIVAYSPAEFSGIRFPGSIPIEDFGFGFVLVTLTLMLWVRSAPSVASTQRPSQLQQHEGFTRDGKDETSI